MSRWCCRFDRTRRREFIGTPAPNRCGARRGSTGRGYAGHEHVRGFGRHVERGFGRPRATGDPGRYRRVARVTGGHALGGRARVRHPGADPGGGRVAPAPAARRHAGAALRTAAGGGPVLAAGGHPAATARCPCTPRWCAATRPRCCSNTPSGRTSSCSATTGTVRCTARSSGRSFSAAQPGALPGGAGPQPRLSRGSALEQVAERAQRGGLGVQPPLRRVASAVP